ncbi:DinB family protein [Kordia sp. YSTF-M3]|uniref:DinB family protein n=1 Tax=Kordia aestuariivivens TaxID=2759037 RepID=A0ABR7QEG0_9FLAO|nr:DinB family protein [Kordia aestuariivivens]MBC8756771.1 DinB family protein [Kordia aestuariivivens]
MRLATHIAKHFREVHFGGNWTGTSFKEIMEGITYEQATTKVQDLNTILTLVFHVNYYVAAVLKVFQGEALNAKDELSFDHPQITSQAEWEVFLAKVWKDAEQFADEVAKLPDDCFDQDFTDKKYGSYYRNIHGIIEHTHYHIGQISLIKKLLLKR